MAGDTLPCCWWMYSATNAITTITKIMPVNVPFPEYDSSITIVTLDKDGNVTIKTEQLKPENDID